MQKAFFKSIFTHLKKSYLRLFCFKLCSTKFRKIHRKIPIPEILLNLNKFANVFR